MKPYWHDGTRAPEGGFSSETLTDPATFVPRLVWAIALGPPRARRPLDRSFLRPAARRRFRRRPL